MEEKEKELYFVFPNDFKYKTKNRLWKIVDQYLFKPSPNFLSAWRVFLLRLFGAKIGKHCFISQRATVYSPWLLEIGYHATIDNDVLLLGAIKLHDYVNLGSNCHLIGGGHDIFARTFDTQLNAVEIGNGAFIGAGANLAMGVKIGEMSVVAAHTTVDKNIKPNQVVFSRHGKLICVQRLPDEEYAQYRYCHID